MFSQCKKYFVKHLGSIAIIIITSLLNAAIGTFSPYLTGSIITEISNHSGPSAIFTECCTLLIIYLISQLVGLIGGLIRIKTEICMGEEFNSDVIFYVQDLPYSFIQKQNITVLNQSINQDTNTVIAFYLDTVLSVLTRVSSLIVLLILCYLISPPMTIVIIFSALSYILIYLKMKYPIFKARKAFRLSESIFFSKLFEQLEFVYFLKTNAIEPLFRTRLASSFDEYLKVRMKDNRIQYILSEWQGITSILFQLIMLLMGAALVYNGRLEVGFLVTFSSYFSQLQGSVQYFLSLGTSYQNAKVSQIRIDNILSTPAETDGEIKIAEIDSIQVSNLSFSFAGQDQHLYNSLSINLQKDKVYCLAGDNGKGKSTLINILLGLYNDKIPSGAVTINGIDIKTINMKWLRKELVAYLSQDSVILQDTYYKNVFLLTNEQQPNHQFLHLCNALHTKCLHSQEAISSDTLSGGEARKICLLRTLLKECNLLILDEPDSSLDERSVNSLMEFIRTHKNGKITIIISHRKNIIDTCDEIIYL